MREFNDERPADCGGKINHTQTERDTADKRQQIGNDLYSYLYDGYKIHERFDPEGPPFAACVVRVFT